MNLKKKTIGLLLLTLNTFFCLSPAEADDVTDTDTQEEFFEEYIHIIGDFVGVQEVNETAREQAIESFLSVCEDRLSRLKRTSAEYVDFVEDCSNYKVNVGYRLFTRSYYNTPSGVTLSGELKQAVSYLSEDETILSKRTLVGNNAGYYDEKWKLMLGYLAVKSIKVNYSNRSKKISKFFEIKGESPKFMADVNNQEQLTESRYRLDEWLHSTCDHALSDLESQLRDRIVFSTCGRRSAEKQPLEFKLYPQGKPAEEESRNYYQAEFSLKYRIAQKI